VNIFLSCTQESWCKFFICKFSIFKKYRFIDLASHLLKRTFATTIFNWYIVFYSFFRLDNIMIIKFIEMSCRILLLCCWFSWNYIFLKAFFTLFTKFFIYHSCRFYILLQFVIFIIICPATFEIHENVFPDAQLFHWK